MNTERQIMRYSNRRLYDTVESRYVSFGDVRQLVLDRAEFRVIDRNTHEDITDRILLKLLIDLERNGESMMRRDKLLQMIRAGRGSPGPNDAETQERAAP